ncbi:MAG: hypothetical protein V4574_08145 [Pseudomonadota bacterium]
MILAALILAGACADRAACPSHAEVEQAFRDQQVALEFQLNRDANPPGAENIVMINIRRIVRITRVGCGAPAGESPGVTCRARIYRYHRPPSEETVRLVRGPQGWTFPDEDAD